MDGARYFVNFINVLLRIMWFYVLKIKRDCFEKFKEKKTLIQNHIFTVERWRGVHFQDIHYFLDDHDMEKQTSSLYMPQQNIDAKRANRIIIEMVRNMFHAQNLDKSLKVEPTVMRFTHETVVQQGLWIPLHPRNCEAERGNTLFTCVCFDALQILWCQLHKRVSSMFRV